MWRHKLASFVCVGEGEAGSADLEQLLTGLGNPALWQQAPADEGALAEEGAGPSDPTAFAALGGVGSADEQPWPAMQGELPGLGGGPAMPWAAAGAVAGAASVPGGITAAGRSVAAGLPQGARAGRAGLASAHGAGGAQERTGGVRAVANDGLHNPSGVTVVQRFPNFLERLPGILDLTVAHDLLMYADLIVFEANNSKLRRVVGMRSSCFCRRRVDV